MNLDYVTSTQKRLQISKGGKNEESKPEYSI